MPFISVWLCVFLVQNIFKVHTLQLKVHVSAAFDLVTYTLLSKTLSTPACWDTRVSFSSYVSLHPACRGFPWLSPKGPFSSDAMPSPWSDLTRGPWPLIASRHRGSLVCLSYRPPPSLDFFLLLHFLTVTSLFACLAVSSSLHHVGSFLVSRGL